MLSHKNNSHRKCSPLCEAMYGEDAIVDTIAEVTCFKCLSIIVTNHSVEFKQFWNSFAASGEWGHVAFGPTLDFLSFPHKCPKCQSPAYIGATVVECSREGCQ